MRKATKSPTPVFFWVSNVSDRNVTLTDLAINIRAYSTVNLLDSKHYSLTREQLEKSAGSGSLFLKRRLLKVRKNAPTIIKDDMPVTHESFLPNRERSILNIKNTQYEELDIVDRKEDEEKFAADNAELADLDAQPQLVKRQ
jgi:hypothetical protein